MKYLPFFFLSVSLFATEPLFMHQGLSYTEVETFLTETPEFRYATEPEMWALVESYGYNDEATSLLNYTSINNFHQDYPADYFGPSPSGGYNLQIIGWTPSGMFHAAVYENPYSPSEGFAYFSEALPPDFSDPRIGHWLVTVPEPATSALAISACCLIATALLRMRKRKKG